MRAANIPLEGKHLFRVIGLFLKIWRKVQWQDIDIYHALRDFTSDPVSFPAEEMRSFIRELVGFRFFLSRFLP